MQEVFEKIIEELEECKDIMISPKVSDCFEEECKYNDCTVCAFAKAIEIVKQEAEKYNNGWIQCSERLPEGRQDALVCFDNIDGCIIAWYAPNGRTWRNSSTDNICKAEPIAWMNLPAPYHQNGE